MNIHPFYFLFNIPPLIRQELFFQEEIV
jgi:hypothetical protein